MRDTFLPENLISRRALQSSQVQVQACPDGRTVTDETGNVYKLEGVLPDMRWRMKNTARSHAEPFYVVERLRDDLDALIRKSTSTNPEQVDSRRDIHVLETPNQTPGTSSIRSLPCLCNLELRNGDPRHQKLHLPKFWVGYGSGDVG
jgi:hypothetical protein